MASCLKASMRMSLTGSAGCSASLTTLRSNRSTTEAVVYMLLSDVRDSRLSCWNHGNRGALSICWGCMLNTLFCVGIPLSVVNKRQR